MEHALHAKTGTVFLFPSKRKIIFEGGPTFETPILLPSFSSKGFPNVQKILTTMEETISDEILVSAYDIFHKKIQTNFDFATLIFLDSGGYEASKDLELSDTYGAEHVPSSWTYEDFLTVVDNWDSLSPTIFVSFDHPKFRLPVPDQISRAKELPERGDKTARCLLLKPETSKAIRLPIDKIVGHAREFAEFDLIGVTEKEVGGSPLERMKNIAKLRLSLKEVGLDTPIHVFGALDTVSSYAYFLSGADVFDGLSWLRYAFHEGDTMYRHAFGMITLPLDTKSDIVEGRCWTHNYQYMREMRLEMLRFLQANDFTLFGKYGELIESAGMSLKAELGVH